MNETLFDNGTVKVEHQAPIQANQPGYYVVTVQINGAPLQVVLPDGLPPGVGIGV